MISDFSFFFFLFLSKFVKLCVFTFYMMPQTFFCQGKGLKMLPFPMKCFDWSSPNFKEAENAPLTLSFASVLHHNGSGVQKQNYKKSLRASCELTDDMEPLVCPSLVTQQQLSTFSVPAWNQNMVHTSLHFNDQQH